MARTKASVGAKISSGKSNKARCGAPPPSSVGYTSSASEHSSRNNSGGNPVCPRDTPKWQKPITNFFICTERKIKDTSSESEVIDKPGSSKSRKSKFNVIESDEEEVIDEVPLTNKVLDDTLELEPLTGENNHKLEEYYPQDNKGKGKKSKGKENINNNTVRGNSAKRDLEEITKDEENNPNNKKQKLDEDVF